MVPLTVKRPNPQSCNRPRQRAEAGPTVARVASFHAQQVAADLLAAARASRGGNVASRGTTIRTGSPRETSGFGIRPWSR